MSRLHQFVQGVSSSWLATFATVLYSLLSVPIALRYLSVDEFGLFVLLLQVAGYFTLAEVGMSAATARILIDHKDSVNNGCYGSIIITGSCVFFLQALIVLAIGLALAPWIVGLVGVTAAFSETATFLLKWLAATSALSLAFRMYGAVLYANKRLDLIHAFMGTNVLFGLVLLTIILATGGGLLGLVWLFAIQAAIGVILPGLACHRLGLLPSKGCWGAASMQRFRELFGFGKDIFLVNVGNHVLEASQLIIVSRTMGLSSAAIWSVSTKLFTLIFQLVAKIQGTAIVFFAEMMVRGEGLNLAVRFRNIYQLTASISVVALVVVVTTNQHFVSVWAGPSLAWSTRLSALLATLVFFNTLTRCGADFIVYTKNIASFRYVYFTEATAFVIMAIWLSDKFGFYGILGASLSCLLLFRAVYIIKRMAEYFSLPAKTFYWTWLKRPILSVLLLIPFVLSANWIPSITSNQWSQLWLASFWIGPPSIIVFCVVALPREIQGEIRLRLSKLSLCSKQ